MYVDSTTVSPIRPVHHCNVFVCSITAAYASIPLCYSITSQQIDFITVDMGCKRLKYGPDEREEALVCVLSFYNNILSGASKRFTWGLSLFYFYF